MSKKWYNLFISKDEPSNREGGQQQDPSSPGDNRSSQQVRSAAQTVAEIAASVASEPRFNAPIGSAGSFEEIYHAAEIRPPGHGYTIMKVADMLQSEHIRSLPPEVKRGSILVALEAAGVKIEEIIEDAVRRDRALDAYERVQQKSVFDLEARKIKENAEIQAEMDRLVAEYRARIQANTDAVSKDKERFFGWRLAKQQEEQKIANAVSYFVTENPITTAGSTAGQPAPSQAPPLKSSGS